MEIMPPPWPQLVALAEPEGRKLQDTKAIQNQSGRATHK